jgi:hypothetical protein
MKYEVISAFRDRRTGHQIDPGAELPEGLDRDDIERLVAARCLRLAEPDAPTPVPSQGTDSAAAKASDLFSDDSGGSQDDGQAMSEDSGAGEASPVEASAPGGSATAPRRSRRSAAS